MSEIATVSPFEALGMDLRFGTTDSGTPFVIGADFARVLDYRDANDAARVLDPEERGTQIVRTPGGDQRMTVFYEDGIWELVFLSRKPEAKAIKKRVKEILTEIRRTGSYNAAPAVPDLSTPAGVLVLAEQFAATARQLVAAEQRAAELEPSAHRWDTLVDTKGDYLVGDAAKMLRNDYGVDTGPQRLFEQLQALSWIYRTTERSRWRAKQTAIETGRLRERPVTRPDSDTGKRVVAPPQVRVTMKGIEDLHKALTAGQAVARRAGAA